MEKTIYFWRSFLDFVKGRSLSELTTKSIRLFQREGFSGIWRILGELQDIGYSEWIERFDTLSNLDRSLIHKHIKHLHSKPLISVLMPVYNTPSELLHNAIDSVRRQLYANWELCIADDASTLPHVRKILEDATNNDQRIRVVFRTENGHISRASNTALEMAQGEFIALLDHDDELSEHALYQVAVALNDAPNLDLLYSDEDKIDGKGKRFGHYFKPDWNPELFYSQNLISHLGVYRTRIAKLIGGFRPEYDGSQDWDFAIRFIDKIDQNNIYHIPAVLYHWRTAPGSTAISISEKSYVVSAAQKALISHWENKGVRASIEHKSSGHHLTYFQPPTPLPPVSIILPPTPILSRKSINNLIRKLEKNTDYASVELILFTDSNCPAPPLYQLPAGWVLKILNDSTLPKAAKYYNEAVLQSRGEIVCLLDSDLTPLSRTWLTTLVSNAFRDRIGAVGAMIYSANNRIDHAGMILQDNAACFIYRGQPKGFPGYANRASLAQNFTAVSAKCLAIKKSTWITLGGMNESLPEETAIDIDFCIRLTENGHFNLWTPIAELVHGKTSSPPHHQLAEVRHTSKFATPNWCSISQTDPAWNPNLALENARVQLKEPPQYTKPWLTQNFD